MAAVYKSREAVHTAPRLFMNTLPPLQQSCGTLTLEKQPDTIHNMVEALHQRLAVLEAWKATTERPRRRASNAIKQSAVTQSDVAQSTQSAAAVVFQQRDLLELILRHLDLPALRMLRPTNRCAASIACRVVCSAVWLAVPQNLNDVRRVFASRRRFKLPLRVALERFCLRSRTWTRSLGTLHRLRVGHSGPKHDRTFFPVEIQLSIDGEGMHEDPDRLLKHAGAQHTRLQAWDLSCGASIVDEKDMGLGLLRPVLSEMVIGCGALQQPVIVGATVAELLHVGGLSL